MVMQQPPTLEQQIEQAVNDVQKVIGIMKNSQTQMLGVANQLSMIGNNVEGSGNTLQTVFNFLVNKVVEQKERIAVLEEELTDLRLEIPEE